MRLLAGLAKLSVKNICRSANRNYIGIEQNSVSGDDGYPSDNGFNASHDEFNSCGKIFNAYRSYCHDGCAYSVLYGL